MANFSHVSLLVVFSLSILLAVAQLPVRYQDAVAKCWLSCVQSTHCELLVELALVGCAFRQFESSYQRL
jgi:hypothetical protein